MPAARTTETLDELQLERLDWLKVASGDALDVLAGASETLWRLRPLLFLAAADEQALREMAERAREFSYRCWRMETALFNPQNFNRRETDIFARRQGAGDAGDSGRDRRRHSARRLHRDIMSRSHGRRHRCNERSGELLWEY